jgi:hypothetical protein
MTVTTTTDTTTTTAPRLHWWRELLAIGIYYGIYTAVRNAGIASDSAVGAFHHAKQVIRVEEFFGAFREQAVQHTFIHWRAFIEFWDVYYGTFHFAVTIVAIVWLFRRAPERYPTWRNTLAVTVAIALVGFATYPLMPPRLLPAHYGFVDTLQKIGGLWSFDSGTMSKISNQYAAMPSLHFAWSSWCACVLLPGLKHWWSKALMIAYPFVTLFAIVVTANHFWLDAAGGALALTLGYLIGGKLLTNAVQSRTTRRQTTVVS